MWRNRRPKLPFLHQSLPLGWVGRNLIWILSLGACTTTELVPSLPPAPPAYTQVPHPVGLDLSDLVALFTDPSAPKEKEFLKNCDSDFIKLKGFAKAKDEEMQGTRELVKKDPVHYHWCFYGKLLRLEDDLKSDEYLDTKQKIVLETFQFLSSVAQGFGAEFHDSRYLRWSVVRYQKISELVFFRKLDLTPEGTSMLVQASNPFALWRKSEGLSSVLDKYHFEPQFIEVSEPVSSLKPSSLVSLSSSPMASPSPAPVETVIMPSGLAPSAQGPNPFE